MATMAASKPRLPALLPARSTACSMVSQASTPKPTATLAFRGDAGDAGGALADHQVEVRRRPADDDAQADDAVEATGVGHPAQQRGDLHGARAAEELDVVIGGAGAAQRIQRAVDQLVDHEVVEARGDDREAFAVRAQLPSWVMGISLSPRAEGLPRRVGGWKRTRRPADRSPRDRRCAGGGW